MSVFVHLGCHNVVSGVEDLTLALACTPACVGVSCVLTTLVWCTLPSVYKWRRTGD